jgi:hypothetical protein
MSASKKRASAAMESGTTTDLQYQIFFVANNLEARVRFINAESANIVKLCATSRNGVINPKKASENVKAQLLRLELYIQWLETNVEIRPALKERTKIDKVLRLLFDRPDFHFQEKTRDRARALCEIWNAQNWGEGEVVEDGSDDDRSSDEETAINSKKQKSSSSNAIAKRDTGNIYPPPPNHPIFGLKGIMHGVALKVGPKRNDYVRDLRYPQREAKVYGHNSLEVGSWWPMQLLALFHGAHGMKVGGIAGNTKNGAYSVVTAGGDYEELDQDKGDVLYYSADRSHKNTDPKEPFPSSTPTLALKASLRIGKPVRVLRAAGTGTSKSGDATLLPTVGIRYDGLYRVVAMHLKTNKRGGLYEQFELERLEGQPPLSDIVKSRPTAREVVDFSKRKNGY